MDKVISTRHIRHDWQTFVDWEQKSVRSLCNVTTKRHLAGIPGITPQPSTVQTGDRVVWGWCMMCVSAYDIEVKRIEAYSTQMTDEVRSLYVQSAKAVDMQRTYLAIQRRKV